MPPFSANISFMFADRPFLERIGAAAAAGFPAVECHFPYEHPVPLLRKLLKAAGIRLTGINTAPGSGRATGASPATRSAGPSSAPASARR